MSPRRSCLALFVLLLPALALLTAARSAAPPSPAGNRDSVAALIGQLGGATFSERERAAERIRARGPAVLPALQKAASHADLEVRLRVRALIAELEAVAALLPKRLDLRVVNQPLSAVLEQIERQTGYKVVAEVKDGARRFSFEMKNATFWEAVERVRREAGLALYVRPLERGIRLKAGGGKSPFVVLDGPFRLEVTRFHEDRDIDFTAPGEGKELGLRDHVLTLTVSLLAEPRFMLLAADKTKVELALDEDGKALTSAPPPSIRDKDWVRLSEMFRKDFQLSPEIRLRRSSAKAKMIRELRGTIFVDLVGPRKWVVVSKDVLKSAGTTCRLSGGTVEVVNADLNGETFGVGIGLPPDPANIKMRGWHRRIRVEDAKGNVLVPSGRGSGNDGDKHWISLLFHQPKGPGPGPKKLLIEDWTILCHPVRFKLKGLPLP